jgi:MFS family permease
MISHSSSRNWLLGSFVAAIFTSAALLFAIEPMFTKMVLPRLGGAASVWSIALVFFQATLLGGYVYAHLLTRYFSRRTAIIVHVSAMLIACLVLPVNVAVGWERPPANWEILWLLSLFAISTGLPFFVLAANAPLLQAWFAGTSHPAAQDPYFLYAASNAGSFLTLACYPLAIEPLIPLSEQTHLWAIGFYFLILMIVACGVLSLRSARVSTVASASPSRSGFTNVISWIFLAAVPSGLLLAVTVHISTDVAAVPLFWAVPLAVYLLTFVIAFQSRPLIPRDFIVRIFPAAIVVLVAVLTVAPIPSTFGTIAVHLAVFFIVALMCHGELARRRPPADDLTAFYVWVSTGGMIGAICFRRGGRISNPDRARHRLPARIRTSLLRQGALPARRNYRCRHHPDTQPVDDPGACQPQHPHLRVLRAAGDDRVFLETTVGARHHRRGAVSGRPIWLQRRQGRLRGPQFLRCP